MNVLAAPEFAKMVGVSRQASHMAFVSASQGKPWRGHHLPVVQIDGHRGGAGGKVWGLALDKASPDLRALLGLPETLPSTPVEPRLKTRPDDRHVATAADKQRIISPILAEPKGSHARAEAFRVTAGQQHKVGGGWARISERALRDWVARAEAGGVAALFPVARSDKGRRRVRITRAWADGCGLAEDVQERIAEDLARTARGLILKGRSARETRRLASVELQRQSVAAGVNLPKATLARLCKLTGAWVARFADMQAARDYTSDHKRYSDKHEYRVHRGLTREPMEVLMGDVHHVDLSIAEAMLSSFRAVRDAAREAARKGLVTIRVSIIGWMDASSHYLWATPVILGPGQGITQRDVALSLHAVVTCPWGGIPREILIDNGSEFAALAEAITRLSALAELSGLGVIKCPPYSPEGKGRLEGGFGILEKRFLSALPGYIAGDRMKSPTKSKGRPVDPYPHGPDRLVEDIHLAVAQFNGTPQDGQLGGLSPKAMLDAKIAQTGWKAQVVDDETFDLVFSREERRDVRQGSITIDKRRYSGPVLAGLTGEKAVPFLIPMRDPDGPVICFRDNVIYRLHAETVAFTDRDGAKAKGAMVKLQKADMARRIASADLTVDVQHMLSEAADLEPVAFNPPDQWTVTSLDKAGVIGGAMTEEEAERRAEEENLAFLKEYLADKGGVKRGASGWNRIGPSCAT